MYCDFKIVNAKGIAPVSPYQRFEGYHCESTRHYQNLQFNLCEETISRTDEGQPRPKYIFNKCGTNIYFFTLQRFGPSPSPNFKSSLYIWIFVRIEYCHPPQVMLKGNQRLAGWLFTDFLLSYWLTDSLTRSLSLTHSLWHTHSLSHSYSLTLAHWLNDSLNNALTHLLTHSLTHTLTHTLPPSLTLAHWLNDSLTKALTLAYSLTHSCSLSHSRSLTKALAHSLTASLSLPHWLDSLSHWLTNSLFLWLTHLLTNSLTHWPTNLLTCKFTGSQTH